MPDTRPLAVVTGASSGIGLELARQFAGHGYDLLLAADRDLGEAHSVVESEGAHVVEALEVDLSGKAGVDELYAAIRRAGRPVAALACNAGIGIGQAFLDEDLGAAQKVVDTNITGTIALVHAVGRDMRAADAGKILITSSVVSQMPGAFMAVYSASKAFLQSFSFAIRNELKDTGVSVTALLPGATETEFFERGELEDTKAGSPDTKRDDAAMVAKAGFDALMKGEGDVVAGFKNKLQVAATRVLSDSALAEMHRGMAEPGSGKS